MEGGGRGGEGGGVGNVNIQGSIVTSLCLKVDKQNCGIRDISQVRKLKWASAITSPPTTTPDCYMACKRLLGCGRMTRQQKTVSRTVDIR